MRIVSAAHLAGAVSDEKTFSRAFIADQKTRSSLFTTKALELRVSYTGAAFDYACDEVKDPDLIASLIQKGAVSARGDAIDDGKKTRWATYTSALETLINKGGVPVVAAAILKICEHSPDVSDDTLEKAVRTGNLALVLKLVMISKGQPRPHSIGQIARELWQADRSEDRRKIFLLVRRPDDDCIVS